MAGLGKQRDEIKRLYESALAIIDERNLYTIKQEIKKHTDGSFGEYLRQSIKPQVYDDWWKDLQSGFAKVGLNFLRFKKKILQYKPQENHSVAYAGYLMLAVVELEAMISNKDYLDEYKLSGKNSQSWPIIKYRNGTVDNGVDIHDFKKYDNKDAIELLDKLWAGHGVISPAKQPLKAAKVTKWEEIGTLNIDSVKTTANAINKAMRDKNIYLRVKYPVRTKGIFVQLQQKRTE